MSTSFDPLQHLAVPALAINQHGRIIYWNDRAEDFFGRFEEDVLGAEWHTAVHSVRSADCCPLCETRRALRRDEHVAPIEVTLLLERERRHVTMVPLPLTSSNGPVIGFLILDQNGAAAQDLKAPIPINDRVRRLDEERMIEELTAREQEILACVVEGLDARSIAAEVGISHATARNYVQRILTKLGVRNKAEAVSVALTYNLLAAS